VLFSCVQLDIKIVTDINNGRAFMSCVHARISVIVMNEVGGKLSGMLLLEWRFGWDTDTLIALTSLGNNEFDSGFFGVC
jgi:hypothetical protein